MKKIVRCLLLFLFFIIPVSVFAEESNDVTLYFFHGDGCPHCAEAEEWFKSIQPLLIMRHGIMRKMMNF